MPDTKQYFISLPGFEDLGRWDVQTYEKKKHELFKKYPDAQIFEFSKYNADEEQGENDYYHIQLDGLEGEGVWDAKTFAEKKDKLFQKYPNAQVYRSRGVDYWYDKALADEESIKTMKEELEALTKEEYALPEEASVNPYDPELSPKEYEEFERQYTAHEQGRQSRKDHLAASIAETQEAYDANPRVIEANERYEAEYAAALEEYKKNYLPNLRKQITDWKAKDVDVLTAAKGASKKHNYGAGPHSDVSMWMAAFEGLSGEDVAEQYLEASEEERYNSALAFLNKAERIRKEHSSFGEGAKNTAMNWVEAWGSQSDLETYTEIYTILSGLEKKLGSLNDVSEADITSNLSRSEQALILAFFEYNAAQAEIQDDASWVYKAGGVAIEAIPFVLEFIATGGLSSAASKGATKGLAKALTSWIKGATKGTFRRTARKVVAKGIRGTAQGLTQAAIITPLRPTAYTNVTKAMTQIGEDGKLKDSASDIAIAVADEYIETLSELSGGAITSVLGGIAKGAASKLLSKGAYETFASWGEKLANLSGVKLLKSGQFHGLPVEMAEEYFGNALREMYDAKALDRMHEGDNFWSMFFGFMPLTVIGGGLGVGQYVNAKNRVNKGAERMRGKLVKDGFNDDQIDALIALEKELSPYSLAEKLDPVLTSMKKAGASKESRDAVIKYAMDVVRFKTLEGTVEAQESTKRQEKLDELTGKLGKFYQTKNEGTKWQENTVTQATLYDGRTVFLTSAKNEMGEFAAVDAETGETLPVSESDIALVENAETGESSLAVESQSLDTYLTALVMSERKTAEEKRMADERTTQVAALQERLKADVRLNIGTSDAPVYLAYLPEASNDGMAHFTMSDGSETILTWEQVGDYLNQPIRVFTDEQLAEAEAADIANEEARLRAENAETNEDMDKVEETVEDAEELEEESNPVHIPMNPDGTVNTDLFWDQNPEEWVKWNDEQRQDGGADSMAQIAAGLQTAEAKLAEASKLPFATPTQREAKDKEMGFWQDKINRYNALLEQYQLAAAAQEAQMARAYAAERLEAAEAALADKMTQAPKRSNYRFTPQYMQAKQKFDAEVASLQEEVTRWQNELAQYGEAPVQQEETAPVENVSVVEEQQPEEVAPSAEELAAQLDAMLMTGASRSDEAVVAAMQAYADAIASGVPAQVVTRRNVMQVLKDAGVSETKMAEVKDALRRIQYIVNGFEANGVAYILADGVITSEHLRGTYVHERQHIMTAVSGIDAALMTMTSREELQEAIAKLTNSNFYDGKGHMVLADELISMAMERAYKGENLDEVFERIGFKNENAINFIKDIDNAQRNDSGLSLARVAGIGGNAAEGGSRQDGRTALSGSTEMGEQGPRSVGRGGETTGDNTSGRGVGFSVTGVLEEKGLGVDEKNGDVRFSVRYTPTKAQREAILGSIMAVTGRTREDAEKWLNSELSLAAMVGDDMQYLDYPVDSKYKAIKDNSDYPQGTVDFNNICRKRLPFTKMFTRLQRRFPNRVFTADELADIRGIMSQDGLTVACGLCYVEDRRQMVGEVANSFITEMQNGFADYASENATKRRNADKFLALIGEDAYVPSIYELTTQEGADKLYNEHRGIWEAFQAFNNARGQQSQNLLQGYAEYKREILSWSDKKVKSVNDNGGLRIFSYSDFEAHHLLDIVQIIIDCASKGVKIQGYTKVPAFARAVANTGIKLNRSLIPLGDTGIVDGQLAFDPVEGIDVNDPDFLESNDNVGNILIGINDVQIRMAMADPRIHYIIPYHARQKENIRKKLNVGEWVNYISTQNERNLSDGKRVKDNVNIYTEVLTDDITNDRQFVEKYLQICKEKGRIPKFDQFLNKDAEGNYVYTPGYYKFLVDFKLFDENGNILPQQPVVAQFDDAFNMQILEDYVKGEKESTGDQMNRTYDKIVEALGLDESAAEGEDVRFSARTDEQRAKLFADAKAEFGLTNNFNVAGYMLPDGSLLNFGDPANPTTRAEDHRAIEGVIMENGTEYDSRWMYLADFMNEGAIRLLPEYAGINLMKAPTKEQRQRLFDFIYKYNGEVILEIADERLNNVAYVEYERRTSPSRIFRDIDGYFNEGIVPQQDTRFSVIGERGAAADKTPEGVTRFANLGVARQMESQLNPDWSAKENEAALKIKMATGWERGADGKWRYETSDIQMKPIEDWLFNNKKMTLKDIVEPGMLLQLYPELGDVVIKKSKSVTDNGAWYNDATNEMQLPFALMKRAHEIAETDDAWKKKFDRWTNDLWHDIIHETQHYIQNKEEFARGGNESIVIDPAARAMIEEFLTEMDKFANVYNSLSASDKGQSYGKFLAGQYNAYSKKVQDIMKKFGIGTEGYMKLGGEVESRNMEKRSDMSLDERRSTLLSSTEDVSREDQILIDNDFNIMNSEIRFSIANADQAIFVSNAAKAVEGIKQEKATPAQWLAMLEKNGGLKAAEDKWMGLSDWLKGSDKKTLTKAEVLEFVNEHAIKIEETHYLENIDFDEEEQKHIDAMNEEFLALRLEAEAGGEWIHDAAEIAYQVMANKYGDDFTIGFGVDMGKLYVSNLEAASAITGIAPREERVINETRLNYTTGDLTNRHEIALTVPTIESWNESDDTHFGDAGDGRAVAWVRFGETKIYANTKEGEEYKAFVENMLRRYHIDEDVKLNRFGTIVVPQELLDALTDEQFNELQMLKAASMEASDKTEKTVLVIDEIQSKRHQEGREKGYRPIGIRNVQLRMQEIEERLEELGRAESESDFGLTDEQYDEQILLLAEQKELVKSGTIPDAPFEKNWHELAMKRMLRYAAENGYDYIAWTKGAQQAQRYNLSQVVNKISTSKQNNEGERIVNIYYRDEYNDYKNLVVDKEGKVIYGDFFGSNLAEIVGKEMALQIMSSEDRAEFKGDGLRVGGEGMRGFYDKMLPAFMNKYGKKWGVKVEDINLPNLEDGLTMHSVPVTEEMKASVMEGQTMFSVSTPAENKYTKEHLPNYMFDTDVRFSLSKNNRQTINGWLNKRGDLTEEVKTEVLDLLDQYNDATLQLCMGKWFAQGVISLPEDIDKCIQAVASAKKAKVNALSYPSPMSIIDQHGVIEKKQKPIDPDTVSTLKKSKVMDDGVVLYDVEESEESRQNLREIINTHYGANSSPWCLLQGDENGKLTEKSAGFWNEYSAVPKRVAFKDGKLLAFYASRSNQTTPWWDRFDRPWEGVPVSSKDKNDPLKREITRLVDDKTGKAGDEVSIIREEKFSDGSRAVAEWASMDPNDIRSYEKKTSSGRVIAGFEYQRVLAEPGNPAFRFFANIFNRVIPKRLSWVSHNGESVQMDSMLGLTEYSMNDVSIDYTGDNISVVQVENYEENGEPRKYAKNYYDFSKSGNLVEVGVRDEQKEWVIITDKEDLAQYEEQARPYFDMAKSAMEDPYKKMEEIKDRILDEAGLRFSVALNPEVRQEMDIIKATAMVNGNYMKAPNGQPTKLTEDQWALVRTNNFKRWFGDWENDPENASKVVDENGEPMVVYHGTAGSINKFENQQRSPGFWFVDREDVANGYAESASTEFEKEKNVVPVFLNIRNPRMEDARGEYPAEFALKSFVENDSGVYEVFDTYEEAEAYQKQNVPDGWIGAAEVGDQNDLVERAKEFGYDGVIMKNMHDQAAYAETRVKGPQTNYVALNPNQIKSATETTGLFSENEDIRFSAIVPHESSMDEIDQMFASLNRDPFVRDLYAKVSDLAHKMNLKIKFVEPWSEAGGANILDKVKYNVDYFNSNDYAQTKAGVLLHELIHSVTVYAVAAKNSSVLTQEMKDAVKQMEAIYDEIKDDPAFDGTYGAESVKEMVSELSNPRFRQKLRAKNLLQRIIDAIKQLLGIDKGTNALDNLEGTLEYMIENFDQNAFDAVLKVNEQSDYYTRFSVRTKPAPKEVKRAYKLFNVDGEGKPHALFIDGANALDEKVWYDADSPLIKDLENLESGYTYYVDKDGNAERKTYKNKKQSPSKEELADAAAKGGRYIYVGTYANGEKSYYNWGVNGGKNGGSVSQFAMRPGWHLTDSPSARHIGAGRNPEAKQEAMYRKPNQRWFEVEYAADVDYNEEAKANPTGDIQTHIPEDGYYSFKTNTAANDVNQNWIISGAIRIVKPLTREEVSKLNEENGVPDDLDYENGTMFSVSERSVDEIVNDGVQKVSEEGKKAKASLKQRMDDIDSKLYYVMRMVAAAQKNYDKKTVDIMTNLAKDLMRDGALSDPTRGEINRLLAAIKNATGKADLTAAATTLMDVMVSNQLRHAKNTLAQMLKIKAKKVNASGVEAQGTLDLVGQRLIATVKESVGLTLEKIDERIADAKEKMDSEFDTIKNNAAIDLVGLNIARKYVDDVVASEAEEKDLRKELESAQEDKKAGKMTAEGLREFRKATEDAIRQNRIERTGAYRNILSEMAKLITESVTKAGQFRDAEKERVEKIHHYANSDLKGLPADAHTMKESAFWNSNIVRFFLKPLSSFEQMLKHFGSKNAEGKGYLYNHFIPGWVEASNKEFSGTMEAYSQLDAKAREVFGGKVKRWSDLFAVEKKRPAMTVKIWDDNKIKEYELSQGNLLYIYMVNKMTDGKMKLRKMGITEEDVRSIYNNLDPRFIEIAEWIQNDFLPSLRDKYNAVHERMFGAPMAAIDNYFPIRVLANARTRDVEVGTPEGNSNPSTITGNIIKRTKNSLALDVLGSDAFDVVLEHIQQMEHWAAFAEWNRDLNTLLSYKKFRNRVQNMSGIYGAGAKAWEEFRATAEIAAGVYRPKVSSMDKILNKVVRGLTAGKIGFRLWTAMKQILSAPAFAPYASPANILKNMVMPKASWDWAMENLEGFNKRWKSRDMGNVRLKKNASGIERWTDDWMDTMTRIGMTPNAFVDAVTCAIGAKSVYETAYAKYEEQGYSAEDAKKKAMVDATVAFNTTQQSGEGAFLSSLQADRDMVAYMTTTYRNANFGMGREFFDAARNLKHRMTPGYKEESLEFMTKQMMRDGLSEAKAKRAAERVYRNGIFKDSARVVTFGFVMQFLWNMGNSVIYQLFGDDDEDKKQMAEDAAFRALFGPIENLTFGNVILDGVMMAREGDMAKFNPSLSPAGQDLTRLIETLSTDPIAGVSDLVNIIFQSAIGTNPQVAADMALAIYDACDGDMETSKEVGIALLRILQAPQSQIDKLIEDEIDFTKDKGLDLTIEEFARRYAEYKRKKNAPYSFFLYSDEEERKVEDRYIKRFTKRAEELKRTRGHEEAKAWYNYVDNEYEEVSGTINELRRKAQKAAMRGDTLSAYEFAEQLNEFLNTPEVKRYEERAGRVKGEEKIRKAMKDMPQSREEFEDIALQLRKELVEEMQLSE